MSSLVFTPKEYMEKYRHHVLRQYRIFAFEFFLNPSAWYRDSVNLKYFSKESLGLYFSNFSSDPAAFISNTHQMDQVELAEALANHVSSSATDLYYLHFLGLVHQKQLFFAHQTKGVMPITQLPQFKHLADHLVIPGSSSLGDIST